MNEQHISQLKTEFPSFFAPPRLDSFELGDGWFELIYQLCKDIQALHPHPDFRVLQMKEKFGGLRFYVTHGGSDINQLIDEAEQKSVKICEECGTTEGVTKEPNPGKWWIRSLCPACREPKAETRSES